MLSRKTAKASEKIEKNKNAAGAKEENNKKRTGFLKRFKNREKRTRPGSVSIAFQISVEQIASWAVFGLAADILYVVLMWAAVIYNSVTSQGITFRQVTNMKFLFLGGSGSIDYLSSAILSIGIYDERVNIKVGGYVVFSLVSLLILLTVQFIILIVLCVVIPSRTYERLKPLYSVTEAAQALKNIDITSAEQEGGGDIEIHTGKEELAGLEDAVNDLLKRARSSYQSQIRFVSDASHELRTPIAVIRGYADMLERWGSEDKEILSESITSIKSEAENMSRLVENLLFLARGDSGRAVIRFEQLDINRLICDIYDEFVMIDKRHEFRLDLREDVKASADVSLLKQCLRILTDNAIKYSPDGTDIILRLRKRDEEHYSIDVQDYGIGIKQGEIDKIFERFYRSDPARNRGSGGYGLGLSIAKWIADKHGGFFEILSYEKLGTRISLVLPYEQETD